MGVAAVTIGMLGLSFNFRDEPLQQSRIDQWLITLDIENDGGFLSFLATSAIRSVPLG